VGVWALLPGYHHTPPAWIGQVAHGWGKTATVLTGPLAAVYFVVVAVQQRLAWRWPLFAVASTAIYSAFTVFVVRLPENGRLGEIGVGLSATPATLGENIARIGLTMAVVIAAYATLRRQIRARA
jgi:hypothetical protein